MKLVIGNSMSKIEGLTPTEFKQIRKLMSYEADSSAMYYSGGFNSTRYLIDKTGIFPTGLLHIFEKWSENSSIGYKWVDNRVKPTQSGIFKMNLPHSPYPEQLEAAKTAYKAKRGIINMPTGTGKSLVIALLINELQVRTLVVVPTLNLKKQLTDSLTAIFGEDIVGGLGHAIGVENVDALDYNDVRYDYHAVIIDEFHHGAAKTYRKLNKKAWPYIYHRYGFTATPWRTKDEENILLESILAEVVYKLDYKTSVYKGYIVPAEFYYYDLPKVEADYNTWPETYSNLIVNNKERNRLISLLMDNLSKAYLSTLVLVKEIIHGYVLAKDQYSFIQGMNEDNSDILAALDNGFMSVVVGTTGCLGEGVDTRSAEYVIIAGLGKSKNAFMQQVGRGLRRFEDKDSCKVILFRDPSHKFTLRHFKEQCKIAKEEYGCIPIKLEMP